MTAANLILRVAVLLPLPFLALSPVFGGSWAFVALFYLSVFAFLADAALFTTGDSDQPASASDGFLVDLVPVILGLAHLVLLPIAILALANGPLELGEKTVMFLAFSLFFGSISTANAHELIHRPDRFRHSLGKWVFISLLFGHHVSAHLCVHHKHVATPLDPNSAREEEGFYRFFHRAWGGSFQAGLAAEKARLRQTGKPVLHPANPYLIYCLGAGVFAALTYTLAGGTGLALYFGFAIIAQMYLMLSDYVQHYGLQRRLLATGKYEAVSVRHSWNSSHVFSAALMLNAPRHSDHHAHPAIPYGALRTRAEDGAPMLPRSLPVMSCIALVPSLWKSLMRPHVENWWHAQALEPE
ncbi:MAG: alkane 1-monooxygenase [Alphaproteobacteria bacterium]|nr:alkane 1-monooxygenase [Alphaproteobacteria bacterium]